MNACTVQISDVNPKWIDNFTSMLKKYKKKKISIVSYITSCENCNENFVSNIVEMHEKTSDKLQVYYSQLNPQAVVMRFCYDLLSLEFVRSLKFMTSLTNYFLIHLNPVKNVVYDANSLDIIYCLFFYKIQEIRVKKKMSIFFIVDQRYKFSYDQEGSTILQEMWKKCLIDNNINNGGNMSEHFEILFLKESQIVLRPDGTLIINGGLSKEALEIKCDTKYSDFLFQEKWLMSGHIPRNLLINIENDQIKDILSFYFIDSASDEVLKIFYKNFSKWDKTIRKGKLVGTYGKVTSDFMEIANKKFDVLIPKKFQNCSFFEKKKKELYKTFQQYILYLFTKQLLSLQSQSLERFKNIFMENSLLSKKSFELQKKIAIDDTDEWFVSHAVSLTMGNSNLSYTFAQKELNDVLDEFSEKLRDSPTIKMRMLRNTNKQTSTGNLRQKGMIVGFGLTAAFRPSGFGNFQFITSYTRGPHVFNFSFVNDKDVAEQEGQGKVKLFKIQPSLNFDIEM
nr:GTP-binding protein [Cryptomonas paramecium]